MKNFKLCYIEGNFAYFTTQELSSQRGDDWDDAPYEHNAGKPYEPGYRYFADGRTEKMAGDWNEDGTPKWEIFKLAFDAFVDTPADLAGMNSRYSVESINKKMIPWLTFMPDKVLFAGATIDEFVQFIESCEGTVYFPKNNKMMEEYNGIT